MKKFLAVLLTLVMAFTIATPAFAAADVAEAENCETVVGGFAGFFAKIYNGIHELLHKLVRAFSFRCPFCKKILVVVDPGNIADALADANSGDVLELEAGDYGAVTLGTLDGVTLEAKDGAVVDQIVTTAETELKDVTLTGFDFEIAAVTRDCGLLIDINATIDNLVIDDATFTGSDFKSSCGIFGNNPNATLTVKNSTFENMGYAMWSVSSGGFAGLTLENCTFNNLNSWVVLVQYGFNGDSTITGCNFKACGDGIAKHGAFAEGKTFTFTNNVIADDCAGHDGKDSKWFELSTASAIIEGNTFGGAEWIPGAAQGLKVA